MEREKTEAAIEASLFAMGNAVSVDKIAAAIGHDTETTRKLVHQMMDQYNSRPGGLEIIELEDSFQLCTRKEYYDTLIKVAKQPKKYVLTDVQLEVLSIIAYKQPVTRQEVEKIRGVNSDHAHHNYTTGKYLQEFPHMRFHSLTSCLTIRYQYIPFSSGFPLKLYEF